MFEAIMEYTFMKNAIWSAVMASIACGIIGTIIIEKKLVMMSGGIAHTAFGGVGMGYFLNIEPIFGALFFSICAALITVTIKRRNDTGTDIIIGLLWSVGMALGILFISFTPGYTPDMTSYLFGNILTVTRMDLTIMAALNLIIIITIISLFNVLKAYMFDEEFTYVMGINTGLLDYLLLILIALTIVILIRVAGIILIIALLTAPPAIVKKFTHDLKTLMVGSIFVGMIFCVLGLWISYELNIASGVSIILLAGFSYLVVSIFSGFKKSSKESMQRANKQY
ncbi:metal ABC transporter permease [Candidatus Contubernalis alkaliaceticus]|uniref:metal ABC transporter permease n=1 Tax=Candidatus Contubernalis alkaliaceticus TaxID=338645 RepID=UPI001F4C1A41|nr:metal ABC transporter permease [Candidatus Contubernalis alkalaceticus]UNC93085.1 metal ABC transporter permease [Candidatus Contubernalis alkalaceticus]